MPDVCTCGAQLPPDARFCHKCGKPQREELLVVEEVPPPAPPPPPATVPEPQPINFRNAIAVRVALLAGVMAFLVFAITGPLGLFALAAGGFFSVYLYRRRTGARLSVLNGARLGWISGIFIFVILLVLLTVEVVALTPAGMMTGLHDQMSKSYPATEAEINQVISLLTSPPGITLLALFSFFLITLLPALGGAVGAKLLNRD